MREYKFRGKRLHNGEWVFGWLYSIVPYGDYHERGFMIKEDVGDDYEVDPSTVGQYTGLKDRNGKEIYEGDLHKIGSEFSEIGVVEYHEGTYFVIDKDIEGQYLVCRQLYQELSGDKGEVIGNISENQVDP